MEDEEENSTQLIESSEDKLPGLEDPITQQCDFVSELDDSKLVQSESPTVLKEDITVMKMDSAMSSAKDEQDFEDEVILKADEVDSELHNEAVEEVTNMEMETKVELPDLAQSLIEDKEDGDNGGEDIVGMDTTLKVETAKEIPIADTKLGTETEGEVEVEVEVRKGGEGESVSELHDLQLVGVSIPIVAEDKEMEKEEANMVETVKSGSGGKRKRGKNAKAPAKASAAPIIGDDVCFICFDGGDLVLCDRRNCPKAYHPSCVNRDEAFFRAKGRWNCGWHLCSKCEKNAHYMCYTCTFSLCKGCVRDAVILCVRGNKGLCETCMKTVMLIENNEQGNNEVQVDFDDKSSWEYLFKDYWTELKAKLSLSPLELAQAKNPYKGPDVLAGKHESPDEQFDVKDNRDAGSNNSSENLEASKSRKRKAKKRSKSVTKEPETTSEAVAASAEGMSTTGSAEWASKELLELVMHMKDGDKTALSQFDVQALLLEYIKGNKLRDPRRKSQIICDTMLQNLFGKARVGHFEMLKLLESHFLMKEDSQVDDVQGSVVDTEVNQLDAAGNTESLTKGGKDRKRKLHQKGLRRGPQFNLNDYAAIDIHNINLIYLRRKLMEDLLEDPEKFHDKVVDTFVRIRITGSSQNHDMYRLVQVVGTSKAAMPYKVGQRMTDIVLEILNLNKTEVIPIDTISNQEFTEDECKRLRQSIKCGLISRLTVGDILDKAMEIQAARVRDWLETEIVRLSHLCDRASETGRRKELRECVEKLQLLKTPEERQRRLEEISQIHADPKMDPSYESEDDESEMDDNKREVHMKPRDSAFSRRGKEPISPRGGDFSPKDSWSGNRKNSNKNWELNRNLSKKNLSSKGEEATLSFESPNDNSWNQGRDRETQHSNNLEKSSSATTSCEASPASLSVLVEETAPNISETEKMWHYKDPSGKVQGPFSMVQLRKWSNTGYFPVDLKIWRAAGKEDDSILLTDALAGRFPKEFSQVDSAHLKAIIPASQHQPCTHASKPYETSLQQRREGQDGNLVPSSQSSGETWKSQPNPSSSRGWATPSVEVPTDTIGSGYGSTNNSVNLPSPTPKRSIAGWTGGEVGPLMDGQLAAAGRDSSQLARSSTSSLINPSGSTELNAMGSSSVLASTSLAVSQNDPLSSLAGLSAVPNSEQGILAGPTSFLPTSQSPLAGDSNVAQTQNHLVPAPETAANMIQSVNSQNPPFGTQGWVNNAPPQNLDPNAIVHLPGQQPAYAQWGGVPSTVMNPAANFSTQGVAAFPPMQGNQFNMQPQVPPNVPWGMGWGGPVPGNMNMNWGPTFQGTPPGNSNLGWAMPTGNVNPGWVVPPGNPPGAIVQGFVPGNANQAWVTQGPLPGNANPGWVPTSGNPGANDVQGPPPGNANPSWVPPSENPGANNVNGPQPGNANPGWGPPGGSRGSVRGSGKNQRRDRFSGQRDRGSGGGRPWNRQSRPGQAICGYHENGHCRKGSSCNFPHS